MHSSRFIQNFFRHLIWIYTTLYVSLADALPILPRSGVVSSVDAGQDAWADTLAGVGPLILLIGEKNTKQLLREARGVPGILSMSCAPLGLLAVLTSMIRLCGSQKLRSYLGYEHEPRLHSALEVTKVNCGGIHADVVDGFISRSPVVNPARETFATTLLEGDSGHTIQESIEQIHSCYLFEEAKVRKGCPNDAGKVNWCFRLTCPVASLDTLKAVMGIVKSALKISDEKSLDRVLVETNKVTEAEKGEKAPSTTVIERSIEPVDLPNFALPKPLKTSFFCTFEGLSELSASDPTPKSVSLAVAVTSLACMLGVQIICLWQEDWKSTGMIMVFTGYFCTVIAVSVAGTMIVRSCESIQMSTRPTTAAANWTSGLVIVEKNTDSMSTTGSRLMHAKDQSHVFEAVWLKDRGRFTSLLSWIVSIFMSLSFILWYLGLRSAKWWLSVSQLLICLVAAFARSLAKVERKKFEVVEDIRVDKRCFSTGVITMQRASRTIKENKTSVLLDLRIYAIQASHCLPLTGEHVAWQAAKLCLDPEFHTIRDAILAKTGMKLSVSSTEDPTERNVVALFKGGVLTEDGLAFPNATMCLAYRSSVNDLAAPTAQLARAIMRQPQWSLQETEINKNTLPFMGGMYISSFDSILTWWIMAEDRNEMGDQQKNLHGSFVLINIALFICLLHGGEGDQDLLTTIDAAHKESTEEEVKYAKDMLEFLTGRFC